MNTTDDWKHIPSRDSLVRPISQQKLQQPPYPQQKPYPQQQQQIHQRNVHPYSPQYARVNNIPPRATKSANVQLGGTRRF